MTRNDRRKRYDSRDVEKKEMDTRSYHALTSAWCDARVVESRARRALDRMGGPLTMRGRV